MDRTFVLMLKLTKEQAQLLKRTLVEHTVCFNTVCLEGFRTPNSEGVDLYKTTYSPLRDTPHGLGALQLLTRHRSRFLERLQRGCGKVETVVGEAYPRESIHPCQFSLERCHAR